MELHRVFEDGWSASKTAEIACKPIFSSTAVLMLVVAATRSLLQTSAAMRSGATDAAFKDRKDKYECGFPRMILFAFE